MLKRKWKGWSILNHDGELWTDEVFHIKEEAQEYLDNQSKKHSWNLKQHKVVKVSITISTLKQNNLT